MKQVYLSYHDIHTDCIELAKIIKKKIQAGKANFNFTWWFNTRVNYSKLFRYTRYRCHSTQNIYK